MMRLSSKTLSLARIHTAVPAYDREHVGIGIVHLGPGAFHRAHQAVFTDDALALGGDWGICGVQMRSAGIRDALAEQDNLYTLGVLDRETRYRVIGAIRELLVASESLEAVLERMSAPGTHIVTLTVTEKGYCQTPEGQLDLSHPDIVHDLAQPDQPRSAVALIVEALRRRREKGYSEITVISCDNLAENGRRLRRSVLQFAGQLDSSLVDWISETVGFPCTMVDSITPATTDEFRAQVAGSTGLEDAWPVSREAFTQWVIEDAFTGPRPEWEQVGVTITPDVAAYENAKLRLLNGAHSTLAYLGLLAGLETVEEAVCNSVLHGFVRRMMLEEVIPGLNCPQGMDLVEYSDAILERFRNPAICYLLSQIAWDGSQKIPFRLLGSIRSRLAAGGGAERLLLAVAAWMHFVRLSAARGEQLTDPLNDRLLELGRSCTGEAASDVSLFLDLPEVFSTDLPASGEFRKGLIAAYARLEGGGLARVQAVASSLAGQAQAR